MTKSGKKILLLALPLMVMCFASCNKEEWTDDSPIIQFKDPKFLEALVSYSYEGDRCDKNNDGQISEKEASVVTVLGVWNDIQNMDEIKYFTALTSLSCGSNQLTSLDLSKNTALTDLDCEDNQLTSLDLSNNTALTSLFCGSNQLTSLDVSKNTALTKLKCGWSQLTSLDLSKNTELQTLWCTNNQLTSLDVSNNTALTELMCYSNNITSLDLSMCRSIYELYCINYNKAMGEDGGWYLVGIDYDTKLPLESLKIYKYLGMDAASFQATERAYGDIIEYVE